MSILSPLSSSPSTSVFGSSTSSGNTSSSSGSTGSTGSSTTGSSSITGLNTSGISFTGLASGLNTNAIVQGLLAVQQSEITLLQNQQTKLQQQQSAIKTIEAQLLTLQSDVSPLSQTYNSIFDARTATSSNSSLATASASSGSTPGVYSFTVNSLAQAEEVASQGFTSASSTITQGTFQLKVGSGATSSITVDSTNNTLQGLANAINNASSDVTASVINDGSGIEPYRLLIEARNTGADNTISFTNNLAASSGGAIRPELSSSYIGNAVTSVGFQGTSIPTANTGAGSYTGPGSDTYSFTVLQGGTVGTDANIQISYTDSTGASKGVITLPTSNAQGPQNVAQGIQVAFGAGSLVTGDTFTIKAYNPTLQQAADAAVSVGSGAGALTIHSASNLVDNLFPGVAVNLTGANSSQPVSITVANDATSAAKAVDQLVSDYNTLIGYINQNSTYDSQTQQAGLFLGNSDVAGVENNLINTVSGLVSGVHSQASSLAAVGITLNSDGTLTVNNSTLNQALSGQLKGISPNDVRRLFVLDGQSTNNGVQLLFAGSQTKLLGQPVQVQVTRAATQATILGGRPLASSTVIDSSNDTFTLSVDGNQSGTITLALGTYTPQALAQEVQAEINANSQLNGSQVLASVDGGSLRLTSETYGGGSKVTIGTGTALSALGYSGTENNRGINVAGSFVVNGVKETAQGSGQILTGSSGNPTTDGLVVRVSLNAAQITASPEATLTLSNGIGAQVSQQLSQLLNPATGRLTEIDQSYTDQVNAIQKTISQDQANLQQQQQSLLQQFTAMEITISQLQAMSSYLGSQLTTSTPTTSSTGSTLG